MKSISNFKKKISEKEFEKAYLKEKKRLESIVKMSNSELIKEINRLEEIIKEQKMQIEHLENENFDMSLELDGQCDPKTMFDF